MDVQYHINLNNDNEFRYHCVQKSIDAFDFSIKSNKAPSRFSLFILLLHDTLSAPFHLARKSVEVAVNIFRLTGLWTEEQRGVNWQLSDLTGIIVFQMLTPSACTAIRITATLIGFFSPSLAVRGWRIAECGESLAYLLWASVFQNVDYQSYGRHVCEEIVPSNAIHYLGEMQTRQAFEKDPSEYQKLEAEILLVFENLLRTIAINDSNCFYKLLDYDRAMDSRFSIGKNKVLYFLSHDIKHILIKLKGSPLDEENMCEDYFIDMLKEGLTLPEQQRLFNHIYLNLSTAFLDDEVNLDKDAVEDLITMLKDLFSQRFHFGRAHFPRSFYDIQYSGLD